MSPGPVDPVGQADWPKPGCDGTISRRCAESSGEGTARGAKPPAVQEQQRRTFPPSNSSRSIPAIVMVVADTRDVSTAIVQRLSVVCQFRIAAISS